jgi:peptidoglycan/xylan/chitin deacetylase (PgdA/CDA1 family)
MGLRGRIVRQLGVRLPSALLRPLAGPAAVFFHGVELDIFDPELQSNHHRIEDFYEIALALKSEFDVAPLSALPDVLATPSRHRRTVFLMSDDGYANTLSVAAPMLGSIRLPWTLFVSTEHIDSGTRNPVFLVRLFARHAPDGRYRFRWFKEPLVLAGSRRYAAQDFLKRFRCLALDNARETLREIVTIFDKHGLSELLTRYQSDSFLNWDDVRALAQRGVIIGAHADYHWPMHEQESTRNLRQQALRPRQRIEAEIGPCRHFAYPFGNTADVCARAWQAVRDAGYEYAFTTLSGTLDGSENPWLLPRYGLGPSEPNLASTVSLARLGNARLAKWQRHLT